MQKMKLNLQFFASGTINASSTTMPSGTGKVEWSSSIIKDTNKSSTTAIVYARRTSGTGTYCTVSGSVTINGSSKSISKYRGSDDKWTTSWKEVGRYTTEVEHNEDGSKGINISFSISADTGGMDGTAKGSGTATLDKINRASKLSAIEDFKLTDTITINITKYITTAVDKLQIKLGDTLIREVANISNGYELTFTTTEQTTIKNLMTSPQATLIFLLTTISGETTLGTSTQSATVTSLDKPIYRNIIKKENGHYQVAINGVVDTTINDVLQVYDDEGNDILNEKVLFTGDSNAAITLSETSANFKYIEVFFRDNDNTYSSVRVNNPNGKYADISTISRWGSTLYIKQKRIAIAGNKIANGNKTEVAFTTAPKIAIDTNANNIYITRVVGYR